MVIRLKPDYDAYYARGLAKAGLGQHSAAIADFDAAIRLKPDDAEAYYNRGLAKQKLGQHFAAISDYDTAYTTQSQGCHGIQQSRKCES